MGVVLTVIVGVAVVIVFRELLLTWLSSMQVLDLLPLYIICQLPVVVVVVVVFVILMVVVVSGCGSGS